MLIESQLRLWSLQILIPKISAMILAALGITDSMMAEQLFSYLWTLVKGLINRGIHIAGYAADGSNIERNIQQMLETKATSCQQTRILHPIGSSREDIIIDIGFIEQYPFAVIQDTKHLAKTCRNNVTTGT